MLGDDRLRDPSALGQGADGLFALTTEALEYRPPSGVGERLEQGVGRGIHNPYPVGYGLRYS